jgi:hypothetical protein
MKSIIFTISFLILLHNIYAIDKNDFCFIDSDTGEIIFVDDLIGDIKKKIPETPEIELIDKTESGLTFNYLKFDKLKFCYYEHDEIAFVIFISSNRYFTNRNITIGNDRYDVLNTYGEANYSDDELINYSLDAESDRPWLNEEYRLWFHFDINGKIDEITIQHF